MKTAAIVQARMGSTRLPGKIMLDLCGKPVLWHVVDRLRCANEIDRVVVATTDLPEDDIVYESALAWGVDCARGSSSDVLARYFGAAEEFPCEAVVRVTSDCPLVDPWLCDEVVGLFWRSGCRYATNAGADPANRTYPRGLDCEVFGFGLLAEAHMNAREGYEREHVTPYMYWKNHSVRYYKNAEDLSMLRWTLDTPEDYKLISLMYGELGRQSRNGSGGGDSSGDGSDGGGCGGSSGGGGSGDSGGSSGDSSSSGDGSSSGGGSSGGHSLGDAGPFSWREALAVYNAHPEWAGINAHIEQKDIKGTG